MAWYLKDSEGRERKTTVILRDSMLLAPAGRASLAHLGRLLGLNKLVIPDGYSIDRMDVLLKERPEDFERYALRDAEIAARYVKRITEINAKINGKVSIPPTLSSIAISILETIWIEDGIDIQKVVGKELQNRTVHNSKTGKPMSRKVEVHLTECALSEELAKMCYHGGRNECYRFGASGEDQWVDADLVSAYVTAMADLGIPDWEEALETKALSKFTLNNYGIARVRFKFPPDTLYPCLPVVSDGSIVYPLEGESMCCSPELFLAQEMKAEIVILNGTVVPSNADVKPFNGFAKHCLEQRNSFEKSSLENLFWKEISNSLYGKTAQGMSGKRVYDPRKGAYVDISQNKITCPLIAAQITSLVRAAVSEMIYRLPETVSIISVTTDGFLSNASHEELADSAAGVVCTHLLASLRDVTGKNSVWEEKHRTNEIISWRTRGQAGLDGSIIARAGFRTPRNQSASEYLINHFVDRKGRVSNPIERFPSIADNCARGIDMVPKTQERSLSMEYDFKREPINPSHRLINGREHLAFETRPWQTIQDYESCRKDWENYAKGRQIALKTVEDLTKFKEYRSDPGSRRPRSGGLLNAAKKNFLMKILHGVDGLSIEPYTYKSIADWLTEGGFKTSVSLLKKIKRLPLTLTSEIKSTPEIEKFHDYVKTRCPFY